MKNVLTRFAAGNKCILGACAPTPLPVEYTHKFTPFVSSNILKRTSPSRLLPGVKSIIAIGVGHESVALPHRGGIGHISTMGANKDYHNNVRNMLNKLVLKLKHQYTFEYRMLVDSPFLCERTYARLSGIGFLGQHGLIISQKFGTLFNIGLLLTTIPLTDPSREAKNGCKPNCLKCINACPTGALKESEPLDAARCISYLTQKKERTPQEDALLGNNIYGCDACQNVCPHNKPIPSTTVDPHIWLNMSDQDFAEKYAHTAMLWQGAQLLRDNAAAVIKNMQE